MQEVMFHRIVSTKEKKLLYIKSYIDAEVIVIQLKIDLHKVKYNLNTSTKLISSMFEKLIHADLAAFVLRTDIIKVDTEIINAKADFNTINTSLRLTQKANNWIPISKP